MAAKLEMYLETTAWVEFLELSEQQKLFSISTITQIDNWEWTHEQALSVDCQLRPIVDSGKIVLLELNSETNGKLGASIEMVTSGYQLSLWWDIQGHPYLDGGYITEKNAAYYQQVCDYLVSVVSQNQIPFRYFAIGSETFLVESSDIFQTIQSSQGIAMWIVKNIDIHRLNGKYMCEHLPKIDAYCICPYF